VPDGAREAGYEVGRALAADAARPQAMLCEADSVALGMIAGLFDGGVRVPHEMAVIGFDGIAEGRFSRPRLTTIAHPLDQLVEIGLSALLCQIEDSEAPTEHRMLEPQLIVRESCGAMMRVEG
jgi:LacI family transcriptional regulator